MKIDLQTVTVAELTEGYSDRGDEGVRGYGGRLNIRPAYQREFVYKDRQREEVIHTVRRGFPLNTMYWAVTGGEGESEEDGHGGFELLDGQQRTVSLCQYVAGDYSVPVDGTPMFFGNLPAERQKQILDYELSIYVCEGDPGEKLDWFKIINIAGERLTDQELRNAIYTGPWLADAKQWFSRPGGPAAAIGDKYVNGSPIRQELLETALEWVNEGKPEPYMAAHQHDPDAGPLWAHYQTVLDWTKRTFPKWRKEMKGLDWGRLYRLYGGESYNPTQTEARVTELYLDDEVSAKKGVYEYLLSGDERTLSLRTFDDKTRATVYERQGGICPVCKKHYELGAMEADHMVPWSKGGKTTLDNCQMLCQLDNRRKGGK